MNGLTWSHSVLKAIMLMIMKRMTAGGIKDDELDDDVEDSDETNRIATTDDVEMEVNINLERMEISR